MTTTSSPSYVFVVPCGARKAHTAAPAAELYTGSFFRQAYAAAVAEAEATERDLGVTAKVLILSAQHGLVDPTQVLAPYERRMGQAGSITTEELSAQAVVRGITYGTEVYAFLPKAYRQALELALAELDVTVADVYEAAPGMGHMKATCASVERWS